MLASKTLECNDVDEYNLLGTVWVYINFKLEVLYERVIQSPHLNSPHVIEQVFNLFLLLDSVILYFWNFILTVSFYVQNKICLGLPSR
jgi:hypothetical protein